MTIDPQDGGSNKITAGAGQDIILGGTGSNTITAGAGNDIIVGNNGEIEYSAPGVLSKVFSTDVVLGANANFVTYGGNNVINVGAGNDEILGGIGVEKHHR